MDRRLSFGYGRTLVLSRGLFFALLLGLIAAAIAIAPAFDPLAAAALAVAVTVYGVVFVASPLLVQHWLTRSRLILRQGWYFRAVIQLSEIESVDAADETGRSRVPLGIHRPLGQPALFVTGGRTNLVAVRLREPRRFWQAFGLEVSQIVFDVLDRPTLLAAAAERRGLFAPVQAHGPDAKLRD